MYNPFKGTRNRLAVQMVLWFAVISLFPLGVATYFNYRSAADELHVLVSENLEAISQRQSSEIKAYLKNQERFVSVLSMTSDVIRSFVVLNRIGEDGTAVGLKEQLEDLRKNFKPVLKGVVDQFDFKRLYLVNGAGEIVLNTQDGESGYGNLYEAERKDEELSRVFERTMMLMTPQISNLAADEETNKLVFYLAAPVLNENRLLGGIVLEVEADKIYEITQNYMGLGMTGETLLAAMLDNEEVVVLNPTRHDDEGLPFQNLTQKGIVDEGLDYALQGKKGSGRVLDYRDEQVIAAWEYLPKMRWGLVVKEDLDETHLPVLELRQLSIFVGVCTLIIVLAVAIVVASSISQPIVGLTEVAEKIAKGDLTPVVQRGPSNEIGILSNAIDLMARNLKSLVNQVKGSGSQVAATAREVSGTVEQQLHSAEDTGAASIEITASARKISVTAKELTGTMQEVSEVAQDTALLAESGIDGLQIMEKSMGDLSNANHAVSKELELIEEKANAIGGIITTMTKVADQTNLLSLNAAIEARKAGEYGKGFKVVAREISRLADQAAKSTLEIEQMIQEMSKAVHNGVGAMEHLSSKVCYGVKEITTVSNHLANVIQQVQGLPPRFEMVLQGMESQAEDADSIKESISHLSAAAQRTIASLKQSNHKLERLESTAGSLQSEISRFQT